MQLTARRAVVAAGSVATAASITLAAAPGASADPFVNIDQTATVTTHVAKPNKDITFTGTQAAKIDLGKTEGNVSADLKLGTGTMKVDIPVIPGMFTLRGLATATLQIEPTGPATGTLAGGKLDVTQNFNVRITKVNPVILSFVNLVPSTCRTASTATMKLSGDAANPLGPITVNGTYTLPNFANCGLMTPVINGLTAGPGNTVTATFVPVLP
ncbi:hypothetical protein [Flexivirga meconopsidis]|uniref:hypothetical protein n=1 Tax=Flexivirga meconopsidis TaxID=2977121 RepID=UPI0022402032|nr:hypothetical protein [Flexivirga meconopsidis]